MTRIDKGNSQLSPLTSFLPARLLCRPRSSTPGSPVIWIRCWLTTCLYVCNSGEKDLRFWVCMHSCHSSASGCSFFFFFQLCVCVCVCILRFCMYFVLAWGMVVCVRVRVTHVAVCLCIYVCTLVLLGLFDGLTRWTSITQCSSNVQTVNMSTNSVRLWRPFHTISLREEEGGVKQEMGI